MAIVVIGGQASGVGKTGAICGLIAAMPERRWTAIKITQCSHQGGERPCDCELSGSPVAMTGWVNPGRWPVNSYKQDGLARTDTYRYMAAGAAQSLWVRTLPGYLGKVMPRIEENIARAGNVLIESNSVMEFFKPDVYALIVSPHIADFKPSARRYLDRADAILMVGPPAGDEVSAPDWIDGLKEQPGRAPRFSVNGPQFVSPGFIAFVRRRLDVFARSEQ
jgi:hypothetical protein